MTTQTKLEAYLDARPTLPGRYAERVAMDGRRYLDDGANFVQWLTAGDDVQALARADMERHARNMAAYVEALTAAGSGPGWAHAGCDHAYGVCAS